MQNYICGCENTHQGKGLCEYHYKAIHQMDYKEKYKEFSKKSYQKHREKRLLWNRQYTKTAYSKQKQITYRRNSRYGKIWRKVFERDKNKCVLCGSIDQLCIDHIVPVLKDGKSTLENMRVLCLSCNSAGGKIPKTKLAVLSKIRHYQKIWRAQNPGRYSQQKYKMRYAYVLAKEV
jgi:5-methylcytosine-specific restriction endonuclease McrA